MNEVRPPAEHADKAWHWVGLDTTSPDLLEVMLWVLERWWRAGTATGSTPSQLAAYGWHYAGPCVPPKQN